jgi:phospholipid/cholesterol/gamma-HCH transport system substrate-binding protein
VSRRREIQVGVTIIVALAILLWGVTWLKEFSLARKVRVWHVAFSQSGGLGTGDEVQVNGVRKGQVQKIALDGDHVVVDLALDTDVTLTDECRVAIRNLGLMGEKVIGVDLKTSGHAYTERDTLQGVFELGMGEVMASIGGSMDALNRMVDRLDAFSKMFAANGELAQTLHNFRDTSRELQATVRENRAALRATLDNFAASSKSVKSLTSDREAQLRGAMDHFSSAAERLDRLSARLDSLRGSLQSVSAKLDRGDGTLGKLVNDDKLYTDVNSSVQSLKELIEDIKKHPKKYLSVHIF